MRFSFARAAGIGLCTVALSCLLCVTGRAEEAIDVGVAYANPGGVGSFDVSFYSDSIIAFTTGVQVDVGYDSQFTPVVAKADGTPDCTPNPATEKDMSFNFLPNGCSGSGCTSIRAVILSTDDLSPLPQDIQLFSCNVSPPADTPVGNYLLLVIEALGSDFLGYPVDMTVSGGFVSVQSPSGC